MGVIATTDTFQVIARPHPFSTRVIRFDCPAGYTLAEVMLEVVERGEVEPELLRGALVVVGDVPVRRDFWLYTRPNAGVQVVVAAVPQGRIGGLLFTIAAIALGGFLVASFGLTGFAAFAVKAGVGLVGTLVGGLLFAPSQGRISDAGPQAAIAGPSITGTQNQMRPYGTVPKIYGRLVNYHPPLGARPYTEVAGGKHFLRQLFVLGHGELAISDIRIGDTPIEDFAGVQYEVREGKAGDTPITLYPRTAEEQSLSVKLTQEGGFHQRTTPRDADEIGLDVLFPQGLLRITNRNRQFGIAVEFEVQYRAVGGSTWLTPDLIAVGEGARIESPGVLRVQQRLKGAFRRSVRWLVSRGQYEVRIRRITVDDQSVTEGENQSNTTEESFWSGLRIFTNEDPVNMPGVAKIAVRIEASDQLSGVIDSLNCTVQARLPVWDGSTWSAPTVTRNPAWAFVDAITGGANARALATSRLDLPGILEWAQANDAAGFSCDAELADQRPLVDVLRDIAATSRASLTVRDGLYSVVRERVHSAPVQHFTPRNSREFSGAKAFSDLPHALKVRFPAADKQRQVDELVVFDDNQDESTASRFEVLDLPFVTNRTQAWKLGRYLLAVGRLRPEVYSLEVDFEHLVCTRGDMVRVSHDVPRWGVGWARVRSVTTDGGGQATAVVLDAAVAMAADKSYSVRFRTATGASLVHAVDTVAGEQTTLTFTTPIASGATQPAPGDLVLHGETGTESVELLVHAIQPRSDLSATLTLMDYSPAVIEADQGEIPAFDSQITLPPIIERGAPPRPVILGIRSDEQALVQLPDGSLAPRILVSVQIDATGALVEAEVVQVQIRRIDEDGDWQIQPSASPDSELIGINDVEQGATYGVRLRTVSQLGAASGWTQLDHTVVGMSTPPPAVRELRRQGGVITWLYPDPPQDLAGFLVRLAFGNSPTWSFGSPLFNGYITDTSYTLPALNGTATVMVKAIDLAGNESEDARFLVLDFGDPSTQNVLLTTDESGADFPGTVTDGTRDTGNDKLEADAATTPTIWPSDLEASIWPAALATTPWPTTTWQAMTYVARYAPQAGHGGGRLLFDIDAAGSFTVELRRFTSPTIWPADLADSIWPADLDDTAWPLTQIGDWIPWPTLVGDIDETVAQYELRFSFVGGNVRGVINDLQIIVDVQDIVERFADVVIASGGGNLTLTKPFTTVTHVQLTFQDDGNAAVRADVTKGVPNIAIQPKNAAGTNVAALIDATVTGY